MIVFFLFMLLMRVRQRESINEPHPGWLNVWMFENVQCLNVWMFECVNVWFVKANILQFSIIQTFKPSNIQRLAIVSHISNIQTLKHSIIDFYTVLMFEHFPNIWMFECLKCLKCLQFLNVWMFEMCEWLTVWMFEMLSLYLCVHHFFVFVFVVVIVCCVKRERNDRRACRDVCCYCYVWVVSICCFLYDYLFYYKTDMRACSFFVLFLFFVFSCFCSVFVPVVVVWLFLFYTKPICAHVVFFFLIVICMSCCCCFSFTTPIGAHVSLVFSFFCCCFLNDMRACPGACIYKGMVVSLNIWMFEKSAIIECLNVLTVWMFDFLKNTSKMFAYKQNKTFKHSKIQTFK